MDPFIKDLDDTDRLILDVLQKESQLSNAELARKINLSPPATHARVKRLENEGYIDRYAVILNQEKLDFDLLCFIFVNTSHHQDEQLEKFERSVHAMPEVLECYNLTGEYDYLIKAVLRDRAELHQFIRELTRLSAISRIHTSVTLKEVKFSTVLPIRGKKKQELNVNNGSDQ